MDRTQLVTIVSAILAKGISDKEFENAAKAAEQLAAYIQSGKHKPPSTWDGNVKLL